MWYLSFNDFWKSSHNCKQFVLSLFITIFSPIWHIDDFFHNRGILIFITIFFPLVRGAGTLGLPLHWAVPNVRFATTMLHYALLHYTTLYSGLQWNILHFTSIGGNAMYIVHWAVPDVRFATTSVLHFATLYSVLHWNMLQCTMSLSLLCAGVTHLCNMTMRHFGE